VSELTQNLLDSYNSIGGINDVGATNLPSKWAVAHITTDLLRLLFPGFFDETPVDSSNLGIITSRLLDRTLQRLEAEIRKCLVPTGESRAAESGSDLLELARGLTVGFLAKLPSIRELLKTDAEAAFKGDPAATSKDEVMAAYPFMETIAVQRLAHELYLEGVPLIPRIMSEWAHSRTGIDLHPGAQIGTHFFVDHGTGTVVGETAKIGNYVKMYQGVGLVAKSLAAGRALRGQKRHPTIGDRVTIYAGATILGGDTEIGSGSTIGASVFLTMSVPANSLVIAEATNVRVLPKNSGDNHEPDYQI
jgi:serine O-acetyltransferase